MKKIVYFAISLLVAGVFASCNKETTLGRTDVTYYAKITTDEESVMIWQKGRAFVEPGFSAVMNGEDITDKVQVSSNLDVNKSGVYTINYTAVNADGFASSAKRTIYVFDTTNPIEGFYTINPTCARNYQGTITPYGKAFEVFIYNADGNKYIVDDLLGGWYCQRAGYGTNYAMKSTIEIDPTTGKIELLESLVPGWGDSADNFENGEWKATDNTLSYRVHYAGKMYFDIVLTKK